MIVTNKKGPESFEAILSGCKDCQVDLHNAWSLLARVITEITPDEFSKKTEWMSLVGENDPFFKIKLLCDGYLYIEKHGNNITLLTVVCRDVHMPSSESDILHFDIGIDSPEHTSVETRTGYTPQNAGSYIRFHAMAIGMSAVALAEECSVSFSDLSPVLDGKRICRSMAYKLDKVIPAETILAVQREHDFYRIFGAPRPQTLSQMVDFLRQVLRI